MMGFPAFPALSAALTQRSTAGPIGLGNLAQAAVATLWRALEVRFRNIVQLAATALRNRALAWVVAFFLCPGLKDR
jgi:hypothetical protein